MPNSPGTTVPIKDIIIYYSGWGGSSGQNENAEGQIIPEGSPKYDNVRRLRSLRVKPGHVLEVRGYYGFLQMNLYTDQRRSRLTTNVLDFLIHNLHPEGRLIVMGYSAGGANALYIASMIGQQNFIPIGGQSRFRNRIRVDLLLTIDAFFGFPWDVNVPPILERSYLVDPCVKLNINWFQGHEHIVRGNPPIQPRSHGRPNIRGSDYRYVNDTIIINHDFSSRYSSAPNTAHEAIGHDALPEAFSAISRCLLE